MFVVLISSSVPDHLRGYLSRFIIEIEAGLFVGTVSSAVADRMWDRCKEAVGRGRLTQICSSQKSEQGFEIRTHGSDVPEVRDFDGLHLVARRLGAQKQVSTE